MSLDAIRHVIVSPVQCHSHVLDGATEGVCYGPIVDGLLAETKVCQLDVTFGTTSQPVTHTNP